MFVCEPDVEISMLFHILGWEIQNLESNFDFFKIIEDVQKLDASKESNLHSLQKLLNND